MDEKKNKNSAQRLGLKGPNRDREPSQANAMTRLGWCRVFGPAGWGGPEG